MTLRGDLALASLLTFVGGLALGVTMMDNAYRVVGEVKTEEMRKCRGKGWEYVIRPSGYDCVALQPRFEMIVPYQGDPLKLRRREIKQAIHSEPKEKS